MKSLLSISIIGLLIACTSSTQLQTSWVDPSLNNEKVAAFKKILVVVALRNETSKRIAEDKIVSQIKYATGVQAYAYLNPGDTAKNILEMRLKADKFDAILLMQLKN